MSRVWMSHVPCMNESCHTDIKGDFADVFLICRLSLITRMNESCPVYEWVMSHVWMSHTAMSLITRMNESCPMYEWVMSHVWMSHVPCMNESCHLDLQNLAQDTHTNESCHTYEWVMSHIWMSHVTHMNESCHTYEWVRSHMWMSHVAQTCEI